MAVPYQQIGDATADQVQRRVQGELRSLRAQLPTAPGGLVLEVVATDVAVPVSPGTITVNIIRPWSGWVMANQRSGVVAETARTRNTLTLTGSADCTVDILVY